MISNVSHSSKKFQIHLNKPILDDYWLTGFFEGDGCLSIYNLNPNTQELSFILRQADPKVLYKIKNYLGFGSVYVDKKGYWTLRIRNKVGLLKIANLLNGKLVLDKRLAQYKIWVDALNTKYNASLVAITQPALLSWQNSWLTGFADADGSFNIQLTVRKESKKDRLRLRFYLDQSESLSSMQSLQKWLGGTLHQKTKNNKRYHRLMLGTFNKCDLLLNYFSRFPPLSTCLMVRFIRYARVYRWYVLNQWQERKEEIRHLIILNKRLQKSKNQIFF
jgi:hypothetical protein